MPHPLRFMIDNDMGGMNWVDIHKGTYAVRPRSYKKTTNQLELDVYDYKKITYYKKCEGWASKIAPLRIMSFDIECLSERGTFPTAEKDSIIQIANVCMISG
jgi:DNA polymerase delta subunit 1